MKNNKVIKYFVESYEELKKVTWPTRKQLLRDTTIVIVSSIVVTAFIALVDLGMTKLIEYIVGIKG